MQCDDDGVCPCRDLVSGQLCDTCVDGYYGLASIGCRYENNIWQI